MLLAVVGLLELSKYNQPTRPESNYAFYLPLMFPQCLRYPLHSGEVFSSWLIEQPLTLEGAADLEHVEVYVVSVTLIDSAFDCPFMRVPR